MILTYNSTSCLTYNTQYLGIVMILRYLPTVTNQIVDLIIPSTAEPGVISTNCWPKNPELHLWWRRESDDWALCCNWLV